MDLNGDCHHYTVWMCKTFNRSNDCQICTIFHDIPLLPIDFLALLCMVGLCQLLQRRFLQPMESSTVFYGKYPTKCVSFRYFHHKYNRVRVFLSTSLHMSQTNLNFIFQIALAVYCLSYVYLFFLTRKDICGKCVSKFHMSHYKMVFIYISCITKYYYWLTDLNLTFYVCVFIFLPSKLLPFFFPNIAYLCFLCVLFLSFSFFSFFSLSLF